MSLITKNTTPAERGRGCVFAELLENPQAVASNNGTITGTPTINNGGVFSGTGEYIQYPLGYSINALNFSITVDLDFTAGRGTTQVLTQFGTGISVNYSGSIVIATDDSVRFNINGGTAIYVGTLATGRHTLTATYEGVTRKMYLDGVQLTLNTTAGGSGNANAGVSIGAEIDTTNPFLGTIYSVRYFDQLLTLQEHIDYYNGTTYNYINEPFLNYPMGMAEHDPTNTRTLDVSGSGQHLTAVNSPVKLTNKKGYIFTNASNEHFDGSGNTISGTDPFSMSIWFKMDSLTGDANNGICCIGTNASNNMAMFIVRDSNSEITGGYWNNIITTNEVVNFGSWYHMVQTNDGTTTTVFLNGIERNSGTPTPTITSTTVKVAELTSGSNDMNGEASNFKVWDYSLTPLQVADLYQRELKQFNDV